MTLATDRDHAKRRVRRAVIAAVIWSLGLACVAINLNWALLELIPREYSEHRDYQLVSKAGAFRPMDLRRIGFSFGSPWLPRSITRVDRGWIRTELNSEFNFEVTSETCIWKRWTYWDRARSYVGDRDHGAMDRGMVERWLFVGLRESLTPDRRAEADELLALIKARDFDPSHDQKMPHYEVTVVGGMNWSDAVENQTIATVIWLALWCCGLGLIWRRARRRVMTPGFDVSTIPKPAALAADAGLTTVFRSHG